MKKEIFQKVTNSTIDDVTWSQACLGLDTGGLGYQDAQRVSHCAYISGVFQSSTSLALLDPNIFESGTTTILKLLKTLCRSHLKACAVRMNLLST